MARDITLEQKIESILYHEGIYNSGQLAQTVMECINEHKAETPRVFLCSTCRHNEAGGMFCTALDLRKKPAREQCKGSLWKPAARLLQKQQQT